MGQEYVIAPVSEKHSCRIWVTFNSRKLIQNGKIIIQYVDGAA